MFVSLFLYGLVVLALLAAEYRQDFKAQYLFKPLAALGFVLLALSFGALESSYGQLILAGLTLCALGDVCLLARKSQGLFMAGMSAFAAGHIFYVLALKPQDAGGLNSLIVLGVLICVSAVFFYMRKHLNQTMQIMVGVYSLIIAAMVIFAVSSARLIPALAALMFAASDMVVAKDRFVKAEPKNALAITPLYFIAQALFALSTQL